MTQHNYRNIDLLEEKMRSHQNLLFALIGGFVLSIFAAIIWAIITVGSGYQIGIMAIAVGIIVGFGVRFFGAGYDLTYGVIGGGFTLFSCLLGNLFTQIGFTMSESNLQLGQVLSFLNFNNCISAITESFTIMDLVFYAIAIYEGMRFSRRELAPGTDPNASLEPPFSSLRAPLAGTAIITLFVFLFYYGFKAPERSDYFYETGEKASTGAFVSGFEDGEWQYFYTSGNLQSEGSYSEGKQIGEWKIYYPNGELDTRSIYVNGLLNGVSSTYYENGKEAIIGNYENGRLNGPYKYYYENGRLMSKGNYKRDREDGEWEYYFENGKLSSVGSFADGINSGIWKYWHDNGNVKEVLEYTSEEEHKILEAYTFEGDQTLEDGTGEYTYFYDDGTPESKGMLENGKQVGKWESFNVKGILTEEGEFEEGVYKIINSWNSKGQQIFNGNGSYKMYSEETGNLISSGNIENGLREGKWIIYYDSLQISMLEMDMKAGKIDGSYTTFYESGGVATMLKYKEDIQHGPALWFHESGLKSSEIDFVDGKKNGVQQFWNESGVETKQELYENGVLIKEEVK